MFIAGKDGGKLPNLTIAADQTIIDGRDVEVMGDIHIHSDVEVAGDIRLTNADCAEDFDICDTELSEPGTVMVVGEEGVLSSSQYAYDKRVAGVVYGAGGVIFS